MEVARSSGPTVIGATFRLQTRNNRTGALLFQNCVFSIKESPEFFSGPGIRFNIWIVVYIRAILSVPDNRIWDCILTWQGLRGSFVNQHNRSVMPDWILVFIVFDTKKSCVGVFWINEKIFSEMYVILIRLLLCVFCFFPQIQRPSISIWSKLVSHVDIKFWKMKIWINNFYHKIETNEFWQTKKKQNKKIQKIILLENL